jgi:hypothetical protein
MKTNLKLELLKACIFILIGAYLCKRFQPETSPNQPVISQKQEQQCKVIIKKVTKPDGTINEVTEILSSQSQKQEVKIKPVKLYGLGLKREYDFKQQKDAYEASISRSVNDSLDVVFSYNTEQVAGVGLVLRF